MDNILVTKIEIEKQRKIAEELQNICKGKKAAVQTYGCQQNEADSERIAGALRLCGYEMAVDTKDADLVIINTCAIREHAELKVLSGAGQLKKQKENNKDMLVGICGCMIQEKHRRDQIKKSYPYVDFVFGTDMHHRLPEIIHTAISAKKRVSFVTEKPHIEFGVISEDMPINRQSDYRAWVSIMYGCNNFCSYCVVPHVRGRERSRSYNDIMTEIKGLVSSGFKDITLLGQNVNSYTGEKSFPQLLNDVAALNGDFWVRFMTSHPKDASSKLIEVMAANEKIARHFHLPFQAGSDRILSLMNRGYTKQQYLEKAFEIKENVKGVAITTDVICGFPTESESDFLDTLDVVKQVGFDMIYTFVYSPRKNTPAEKMEGQIPHEEKVRRFNALTELQNENALKNNKGLIDQTIKVLSDDKDEKEINIGRSSQNKIVALDKPIPKGVFVNAIVKEAQPYALIAEVID
ncbi:MAG: tRNA (N6-isopentenyl adenosine(37)-C2)-methylthiotransferase MiaB [Clostridiales bacterium GWF2_36_10]|nr:MAG: tRNA (N6-isopentenyl adenosine(37)-C2)-methylthiotransferase MiaB [Clostridiales bacterium GWF2_36_10]HAN20142.1 tRNA (N6-isopentenyl adenosine(37)-C2)-methylthiotransferase MiaB [Clostridiales bacterium]